MAEKPEEVTLTHEEVAEDKPEVVTEEKPQEVTEEKPQETLEKPEEVAEKPEEVTLTHEEVVEEKPEETLEKPEEVAEKPEEVTLTHEEVAEEKPEEVTEEKPQEVTEEKMQDVTPGDVTEVSEEKLTEIPLAVTEKKPEEVTERPEEVPKRTDEESVPAIIDESKVQTSEPLKERTIETSEVRVEIVRREPETSSEPVEPAVFGNAAEFAFFNSQRLDTTPVSADYTVAQIEPDETQTDLAVKARGESRALEPEAEPEDVPMEYDVLDIAQVADEISVQLPSTVEEEKHEEVTEAMQEVPEVDQLVETEEEEVYVAAQPEDFTEDQVTQLEAPRPEEVEQPEQPEAEAEPDAMVEVHREESPEAEVTQETALAEPLEETAVTPDDVETEPVDTSEALLRPESPDTEIAVQEILEVSEVEVQEETRVTIDMEVAEEPVAAPVAEDLEARAESPDSEIRPAAEETRPVELVESGVVVDIHSTESEPVDTPELEEELSMHRPASPDPELAEEQTHAAEALEEAIEAADELETETPDLLSPEERAASPDVELTHEDAERKPDEPQVQGECPDELPITPHTEEVEEETQPQKTSEPEDAVVVEQVEQMEVTKQPADVTTPSEPEVTTLQEEPEVTTQPEVTTLQERPEMITLQKEPAMTRQPEETTQPEEHEVAAEPEVTTLEEELEVTTQSEELEVTAEAEVTTLQEEPEVTTQPEEPEVTTLQEEAEVLTFHLDADAEQRAVVDLTTEPKQPEEEEGMPDVTERAASPEAEEQLTEEVAPGTDEKEFEITDDVETDEIGPIEHDDRAVSPDAEIPKEATTTEIIEKETMQETRVIITMEPVEEPVRSALDVEEVRAESPDSELLAEKPETDAKQSEEIDTFVNIDNTVSEPVDTFHEVTVDLTELEMRPVSPDPEIFEETEQTVSEKIESTDDTEEIEDLSSTEARGESPDPEIFVQQVQETQVYAAEDFEAKPEPEEPEVMTQPEEPEVTALHEEPNVTALQQEPEVTTLQEEPEVTTLQEEPEVTPQPEEPEVTTQTEAEVTALQEVPEVTTLQEEPEVTPQPEEPEVTALQEEPKIPALQEEPEMTAQPAEAQPEERELVTKDEAEERAVSPEAAELQDEMEEEETLHKRMETTDDIETDFLPLPDTVERTESPDYELPVSEPPEKEHTVFQETRVTIDMEPEEKIAQQVTVETLEHRAESPDSELWEEVPSEKAETDRVETVETWVSIQHTQSEPVDTADETQLELPADRAESPDPEWTEEKVDLIQTSEVIEHTDDLEPESVDLVEVEERAGSPDVELAWEQPAQPEGKAQLEEAVETVQPEHPEELDVSTKEPEVSVRLFETEITTKHEEPDDSTPPEEPVLSDQAEEVEVPTQEEPLEVTVQAGQPPLTVQPEEPDVDTQLQQTEISVHSAEPEEPEVTTQHEQPQVLTFHLDADAEQRDIVDLPPDAKQPEEEAPDISERAASPEAEEQLTEEVAPGTVEQVFEVTDDVETDEISPIELDDRAISPDAEIHKEATTVEVMEKETMQGTRVIITMEPVEEPVRSALDAQEVRAESPDSELPTGEHVEAMGEIQSDERDTFVNIDSTVSEPVDTFDEIAVDLTELEARPASPDPEISEGTEEIVSDKIETADDIEEAEAEDFSSTEERGESPDPEILAQQVQIADIHAAEDLKAEPQPKEIEETTQELEEPQVSSEPEEQEETTLQEQLIMTTPHEEPELRTQPDKPEVTAVQKEPEMPIQPEEPAVTTQPEQPKVQTFHLDADVEQRDVVDLEPEAEQPQEEAPDISERAASPEAEEQLTEEVAPGTVEQVFEVTDDVETDEISPIELDDRAISPDAEIHKEATTVEVMEKETMQGTRVIITMEPVEEPVRSALDAQEVRAESPDSELPTEGPVEATEEIQSDKHETFVDMDKTISEPVDTFDEFSVDLTELEVRPTSPDPELSEEKEETVPEKIEAIDDAEEAEAEDISSTEERGESPDPEVLGQQVQITAQAAEDLEVPQPDKTEETTEELEEPQVTTQPEEPEVVAIQEEPEVTTQPEPKVTLHKEPEGAALLPEEPEMPLKPEEPEVTALQEDPEVIAEPPETAVTVQPEESELTTRFDELAFEDVQRGESPHAEVADEEVEFTQVTEETREVSDDILEELDADVTKDRAVSPDSELTEEAPDVPQKVDTPEETRVTIEIDKEEEVHAMAPLEKDWMEERAESPDAELSEPRPVTAEAVEEGEAQDVVSPVLIIKETESEPLDTAEEMETGLEEVLERPESPDTEMYEQAEEVREIETKTDTADETEDAEQIDLDDAVERPESPDTEAVWEVGVPEHIVAISAEPESEPAELTGPEERVESLVEGTHVQLEPEDEIITEAQELRAEFPDPEMWDEDMIQTARDETPETTVDKLTESEPVETAADAEVVAEVQRAPSPDSDIREEDTETALVQTFDEHLESQVLQESADVVAADAEEKPEVPIATESPQQPEASKESFVVDAEPLSVGSAEVLEMRQDTEVLTEAGTKEVTEEPDEVTEEKHEGMREKPEEVTEGKPEEVDEVTEEKPTDLPENLEDVTDEPEEIVEVKHEEVTEVKSEQLIAAITAEEPEETEEIREDMPKEEADEVTLVHEKVTQEKPKEVTEEPVMVTEKPEEVTETPEVVPKINQEVLEEKHEEEKEEKPKLVTPEETAEDKTEAVAAEEKPEEVREEKPEEVTEKKPDEVTEEQPQEAIEVTQKVEEVTVVEEVLQEVTEEPSETLSEIPTEAISDSQLAQTQKFVGELVEEALIRSQTLDITPSFQQERTAEQEPSEEHKALLAQAKLDANVLEETEEPHEEALIVVGMQHEQHIAIEMAQKLPTSTEQAPSSPVTEEHHRGTEAEPDILEEHFVEELDSVVEEGVPEDIQLGAETEIKDIKVLVEEVRTVESSVLASMPEPETRPPDDITAQEPVRSQISVSEDEDGRLHSVSSTEEHEWEMQQTVQTVHTEQSAFISSDKIAELEPEAGEPAATSEDIEDTEVFADLPVEALVRSPALDITPAPQLDRAVEPEPSAEQLALLAKAKHDVDVLKETEEPREKTLITADTQDEQHVAIELAETLPVSTVKLSSHITEPLHHRGTEADPDILEEPFVEELETLEEEGVSDEAEIEEPQPEVPDESDVQQEEHGAEELEAEPVTPEEPTTVTTEVEQISQISTTYQLVEHTKEEVETTVEQILELQIESEPTEEHEHEREEVEDQTAEPEDAGVTEEPVGRFVVDAEPVHVDISEASAEILTEPEEAEQPDRETKMHVEEVAETESTMFASVPPDTSDTQHFGDVPSDVPAHELEPETRPSDDITAQEPIRSQVSVSEDEDGRLHSVSSTEEHEWEMQHTVVTSTTVRTVHTERRTFISSDEVSEPETEPVVTEPVEPEPEAITIRDDESTEIFEEAPEVVECEMKTHTAERASEPETERVEAEATEHEPETLQIQDYEVLVQSPTEESAPESLTAEEPEAELAEPEHVVEVGEAKPEVTVTEFAAETERVEVQVTEGSPERIVVHSPTESASDPEKELEQAISAVLEEIDIRAPTADSEHVLAEDTTTLTVKTVKHVTFGAEDIRQVSPVLLEADTSSLEPLEENEEAPGERTMEPSAPEVLEPQPLEQEAASIDNIINDVNELILELDGGAEPTEEQVRYQTVFLDSVP